MVEGAPHTAKGSMINLSVLGCPSALVYKGARGRPAGPWGAPRRGRSPPPSRSRTPPFLVQLGGGRGKEGEGEREGKRGRRPLVQFGLLKGGHAASPMAPSSLSHKAHVGSLVPPRGFP